MLVAAVSYHDIGFDYRVVGVIRYDYFANIARNGDRARCSYRFGSKIGIVLQWRCVRVICDEMQIALLLFWNRDRRKIYAAHRLGLSFVSPAQEQITGICMMVEIKSCIGRTVRRIRRFCVVLVYFDMRRGSIGHVHGIRDRAYSAPFCVTVNGRIFLVEPERKSFYRRFEILVLEPTPKHATVFNGIFQDHFARGTLRIIGRIYAAVQMIDDIIRYRLVLGVKIINLARAALARDPERQFDKLARTALFARIAQERITGFLGRRIKLVYIVRFTLYDRIFLLPIFFDRNIVLVMIVYFGESVRDRRFGVLFGLKDSAADGGQCGKQTKYRNRQNLF